MSSRRPGHARWIPFRTRDGDGMPMARIKGLHHVSFHVSYSDIVMHSLAAEALHTAQTKF